MPTKGRGFTVLELTITCMLFGVLSVVLVASLSQVTGLWRRSSSRDDAVAQILKAKAAITRDLNNASAQSGQFATTHVGPSLPGSGFDGDALTFLSSDNGTSAWNNSVSTGQASMQSEITYYLYIPNAANAYGIVTPADGHAPDSTGYEQQCPCKWLLRRVDLPAAPPMTMLGWSSLLPSTQPTSLASTSQIQVVANQLFQLKVLASGPLWTIQLGAVAVADATHKIALGSLPLGQSSYTLVEQFTVPINN